MQVYIFQNYSERFVVNFVFQTSYMLKTTQFKDSALLLLLFLS